MEYSFNKPLGDSLRLLSSLTYLEFGRAFNQSPGDSLRGLSSLTHLIYLGTVENPLGYSIQGLPNPDLFNKWRTPLRPN